MEWAKQRDSSIAEPIDDAGVLIVDDDMNCLQLLQAYLEMEGFKVTCAANGDEALVHLKSKPFWLMFTDYNMPGMNGLQLSEEALKAAPGLIIIMVTGDPLKQLKPVAAKLGLTAILAKPFDINKLLSIVRMENKRRITQHNPPVLPP